MDLELDGRVFYVTGGSRGVGRAIVSLLLAEGSAVATCARDIAQLGQLRATLPSSHRSRLLSHAADVRDAPAASQIIADAAARFGRLDGVVANAGAGSLGGVLATPDSGWRDQFEMKVASVLHVVRPAIPVLQRSDAGRIVIVNGVTAHLPDPGMAAVSAARAAVASLTRSLAIELAPVGICVNAISLGAIITDRQRARHAASGTSEPFEQWCSSEAARCGVLLGRLGWPEEVAPAAAFLLSPLSSYVTGSSLDVSGGAGGRT